MPEYLITDIVNPVSSRLLQGHQFCTVDLERQIELEKGRLQTVYYLYFWMINTDLNERVESIPPSLFERLL